MELLRQIMDAWGAADAQTRQEALDFLLASLPAQAIAEATSLDHRPQDLLVSENTRLQASSQIPSERGRR